MKNKIVLLMIFLLAFLLRFWQLGVNPASLDWDEASLGYNAYSILKTGRDEYGSFMPLAIRSFNDYKPPLYTYLTTIPIALFGLNEFSTRFISAFLGTLSIVIGYFLIKELFPQKNHSFYTLFAFFFAVSPWHIQFSRIAFEANIALFFFLTGILFFIKGLIKGTYLIVSSVFFGCLMYAYHSPRLVVPLLLIGIFIIYLKQILRKWKVAGVSIFIIALFFFPLLLHLGNATGMRLGSVTVLNANERLGPSIKAIEYDQSRDDLIGKLTHNRRIVFAREILGGYLDHFNIDFLFLFGDPPGRHHSAGMGMLYFWDSVFVLFGIYFLLRDRNRNKYLLFWWFLVAPAASAITTGTPHAVRALLYIPTYQIFITVGIWKFLKFFRSYRYVVFFVIFLFLLNFYYYLHMYYIHTPIEYAPEWQYGYRQVVEEVRKLEDKYEKVVVTYHYDQPYVYFLFYNQIDPTWYQAQWNGEEIQRSARSFGKYEFRYLDWEKDSQLSQGILVGTGEEIPKDVSGVVKDILFPDGSVAFRIVAR